MSESDEIDALLDDDLVEVVDVSEEKIVPNPAALAEVPGLMRASDLLPEVAPVEAPDDAVPPTPEEADLMNLPLAERERIKLQRMTPEQRMRYGAAQAEINAMPVVQAFAAEEDRIKASKEAMSAAFIAAYRKKKEKT